MTIVLSKRDGISIFHLKGQLDSQSTMQLNATFFEVFEKGDTQFIWDCSELTYVSSSGLRIFLQALKQLHATGGRLIITAMQPQVVEVLDMSGLKSLMILKPDIASALAEII